MDISLSDTKQMIKAALLATEHWDGVNQHTSVVIATGHATEWHVTKRAAPIFSETTIQLERVFYPDGNSCLVGYDPGEDVLVVGTPF